MVYSEKFNRDDIHFRSVIVGLINLLNQEIFLINTLDNDTQEIVEVPFYYSFTGDERYLQDHFLEWRDCTHPKFMNGVFDPIPRGVVKLGDVSIQQSNMTQRWIRGKFTRIVDGNIQTYSAYINSVPLEMNFEVELRSDTMTDILKTVQAIWEVFYKIQIIHVAYKGVMIPCQIGFAESTTIEKAFEFSYPSDTKISATFSLSVETYFPIFDEPNLGSNNAVSNINKMNEWLNKPVGQGGIDLLGDNDKYKRTAMNNGNTYFVGQSRRDKVQVKRGTDKIEITENASGNGKSIRKVGNVMESIVFGYFQGPGESTNATLTIVSPQIGEEITATKPLNITWKYSGFIHKVDLYYSIDFGATWVNIERLIPASLGQYTWNVPNISKLHNVLVISPNGNGEGAIVKALIDITGAVSDIIIINPGAGYDQTVVLELESSTGSGCELIASVVDGMIVDALIVNSGSNYTVSSQEEISLRITSSTGNADYILSDSDGNLGTIIVK